MNRAVVISWLRCYCFKTTMCYLSLVTVFVNKLTKHSNYLIMLCVIMEIKSLIIFLIKLIILVKSGVFVNHQPIYHFRFQKFWSDFFTLVVKNDDASWQHNETNSNITVIFQLQKFFGFIKFRLGVFIVWFSIYLFSPLWDDR